MTGTEQSRGRSERPYRDQVLSGLRLAGWVCLGILTCGLLVGGAGIAFSEIPGSKAIGYACLAAGAAILISTMRLWARSGGFSGFFLMGALAALVQFLTGKQFGNLSIQVPRWISILLVVLMLFTRALFVEFKKRRLSLVDRVALTLWAGLWIWSVYSKAALILLTISVVVLVLAHLTHRAKKRRQVGVPSGESPVGLDLR